VPVSQEQDDVRTPPDLRTRVKDDAKHGRTFSNIVAEFTRDFDPDRPIKIIGGQHRFQAISEALAVGVDEWHGLKVYFGLNMEQRLDVQLTRLEDRILFLHRKFSGTPLDRSASWWADLRNATNLRNELTHPKGAPTITDASVRRALQAIVDTINALYLAVYHARFPAASRGLQSKFSF